MKLRKRKLLDIQTLLWGKIKRKKGSSSIFLMIILSGVISLTLALIQVANYYSNISYVDSLLNLTGRSILSEFNKNLKNEYGLIAFKGNEESINRKLSEYVNYTLKTKGKMNLEKINSDTSIGAMNNITSFQKEIIEYTKYALARKIISEKVNTNREVGESYKIIKNERIIEGLPSKNLGNPNNFINSIISNIGNISFVFREGTDEFLINRYIMMNFKSGTKDIERETFFENECEYILYGNFSDMENQKEFRRDMKIIRNAINFTFLLFDTTKSSQLSAAAAVLTPGPAAPLTKLVLTEAWAYFEAENDVLLLEKGKKVPIQKNNSNWATDLDSVINKENKYIDNKAETGLTYDNYLEIFLYFRDRPTKLFRVMDLIQINMKGLHDRDFLIEEHNFGYSVEVTINGRGYKYYEKY